MKEMPRYYSGAFSFVVEAKIYPYLLGACPHSPKRPNAFYS